MPDLYRNERGTMSSVSRSRVPMTLDQQLETPSKGLEVVNRSTSWATVSIVDYLGRTSPLHVPPGSVIFSPVLVTRVNATGTTVSGDVLIFALVDA